LLGVACITTTREGCYFRVASFLTLVTIRYGPPPPDLTKKSVPEFSFGHSMLPFLTFDKIMVPKSEKYIKIDPLKKQ
jgi:hypothetical protein